jgi:SAM-dependent methyltransferase
MITVDFGRLPSDPGKRILDVGCGSGRHTAEAARRSGWTAIGSDLNPADLRSARDRLNYHEQAGATGGGPWGFLAADATRLPFADQTFDIVVCSEVLEHIPDHHLAVAELVRVLKNGGDLVVSVPRYLPERICWALSSDYYQSNGGHVRVYRRRQLVDILAKAGVQVWDHHWAHGLHAPYWWLKCLVGPTRTDSRLVNLYHRLLVWDMMKKPRLSRALDRAINPIAGKSLVLYATKP